MVFAKLFKTILRCFSYFRRYFFERKIRSFSSSNRSNIGHFWLEPNLKWSNWKVLHLGKLLALPRNIRLGCKGLAVTKHSSLFRKFVNYGLKKFYNIGPWRPGGRNCFSLSAFSLSLLMSSGPWTWCCPSCASSWRSWHPSVGPSDGSPWFPSAFCR